MCRRLKGGNIYVNNYGNGGLRYGWGSERFRVGEENGTGWNYNYKI